jgi:HAE1 family hydrophobic/amphiphilic exporter-1
MYGFVAIIMLTGIVKKNAIMGTMPIAVGYGAGGEARQPLELCVVGGLITSQLLTLYITLVYYVYLDKAARYAGRLFGRKAGAPARAEVG